MTADICCYRITKGNFDDKKTHSMKDKEIKKNFSTTL